jgi:hypothetical protein
MGDPRQRPASRRVTQPIGRTRQAAQRIVRDAGKAAQRTKDVARKAAPTVKKAKAIAQVTVAINAATLGPAPDSAPKQIPEQIKSIDAQRQQRAKQQVESEQPKASRFTIAGAGPQRQPTRDAPRANTEPGRKYSTTPSDESRRRQPGK